MLLNKNQVMFILYLILVIFLLINIIELGNNKESFKNKSRKHVDCYIGTNLNDSDKKKCNKKGNQCKFVTLSDGRKDCVPASSNIDKVDYKYLNRNSSSNSSINSSNSIKSKYENISNRNINSLIISPYTEYDKYYGSYIVNKNANNNNENYSNRFYETSSLKSNNTWQSIQLNNFNGSIINELFFDKFKNLLIVCVDYKDNKLVYSLYKGLYKSHNESFDMELLTNNIPVKTLCYDKMSSKLLGISSYDGQIYQQKFDNENYDEWIGPMNYDIPMKKIMYSKDGYLIGIGLLDNYIYIKEGLDWKTSKWDKTNINKTQVYDLIYDIDGCLIASSPKGIIKQINPELSSEFVSIRDYDKTHKQILFKSDILKYRIGYEFLDEIFDVNTDMGKYYKKIYDIKKMTKDLCNNKKHSRATNMDSKSKNISDDLSYKNTEINELYKKIDELNMQMNK